MPNKLTIDQINDLALNLTFPYHYIKLMCDGYKIELMVEPKPKSKLSYHVTMHINGQIKSEWIFAEEPYPEQKFLNRLAKPLYRKSDIAVIEKNMGKRRAKKYLDKHQETNIYYRPFWPSGKAALTHLNRICESIEVLESI